MAKFIKISVMDESYRRSMLRELEDEETEVRFGGSSAFSGHAFSHITNHIVIAHHAHGASAVHHSYLGGSAGAMAGIMVALSLVGVFLFLVFAYLLWLWGYLKYVA